MINLTIVSITLSTPNPVTPTMTNDGKLPTTAPAMTVVTPHATIQMVMKTPYTNSSQARMPNRKNSCVHNAM